MFAITDNIQDVAFLFFSRAGDLINPLRRFAKQNICTQNDQRCRRRLPELAQPAQHANRRRAPQCGGGIQAAHVHAFAHDNARAEKTDSGDHLSRNTPRAIRRC